jgi:hypothetical protein
MDKFNIEVVKLFYEEPIIQKKTYKPLTSTKEQVKLYPVYYKNSYKLQKKKEIFDMWYYDNRTTINNLFNNFVKIFIRENVYFYTDLKIVYKHFVEHLYASA